MKQMKRLLTIFLALALLLTFIPTAAFAVEIQRPPFSLEDAGLKTVTFAGMKWYVVGDATSGVTSPDNTTLTLLLASGQNYGTTAFNESVSSNEYSGSTLQSAMDAAYDALSPEEQAFVVARDLPGGGANLDADKVKGADVLGAKFWPLSILEVGQILVATRSFDNDWWLRSPGEFDNRAAYVFQESVIQGPGTNVATDTYAVRPAFYLDTSSVLFISAADAIYGKSSVTVGEFSEAASLSNSRAMKFTIKDASLTLASVTPTAVNERTISFDYTGATPGKTLSAVVLNSTGDLRYYGKLATGISASGSVTVTLPSVFRKTDTLHIFVEECNGDDEMDYASEMVQLPVQLPSATLASVTPTAVNGRTISFDYAGATPGKTLSAVLLDANDDPWRYDNLETNISASGSATVTLPGSFRSTDTLHIFVEDGNDDNGMDYASVRIQLPVRFQSTPGGLSGIDCTTAANNNGQITGTTTAMEYSADGITWTACGAPSTIGLAEGSYQVRYAERVDNGTAYLTSPSTTVVIASFAPYSAIGFGGKQWVVIGYNGSALGTGGTTTPADALTLLLASGQSYDMTEFGADNEYSGSDLQAAMDAAYNGLPLKEQGFVLSRTLTGGSGLYNSGAVEYNDNHIAGQDVTDAYFWPLSVNEAAAVPTSLRAFNFKMWWLRTPGYDYGRVAFCGEDGTIISIGDMVAHETVAVRPAFHLDLSSVLFASAAEGGKASAVGGDLVSAAQAGAVKFTMKTAEPSFLNLEVADQAARTALPGDSLTIAYTGALTGADNFVSCIITGSAGDALYYGKLATDASGDVVINIPTDMPAGSYTLKLFNEQINGDNFTDFASTPEEIPLTVRGYTISGTITGSDAPGGLAASVQLRRDGNNVGSPVTASADGAYTISDVSIGSGYTVTASMPGYTTGATAAFAVSGDVTGKDLVLQRPTSTATLTISAMPNDYAVEGVAYSKTVPVTYTGGAGVLTYSTASTLPGGVSLNSTTGVISGTPQAGSTGSYPITVSVTDGNLTATGSYTLTVSVIAQPPLLAISNPGTVTVKQGQPLTLTLTVQYTGGGTLTFGATGLPGGVTINTSTGVISGTPTTAGDYPVTLTAGDGTLSDSAAFIIKVTDQSTNPDPGPGPDPTIYTHRTLSDSATGVTVSGRMTSGATLSVKEQGLHAEGACPACDEIRARQAAGELIILCDISLTGGYTGSLEVGIPVGAKYNGQTVTILHCINGKLESVTCTVQNGMAQGTFKGLSPFAVFSGSEPELWDNPFEDVFPNDWFYSDVQYAVENGLFAGTSAMTFSPNTPMTRGMLVTVLGRMAGIDAAEYAVPSFDDTPVGAYYTPYVSWAAQNNIVAGYNEGTFGPDDPITRQDVAVVLTRYMTYAEINIPVTQEYRIFADEDQIADYAKNAVQLMNKLGIINGIGENKINPQGSATRAEVAAMLHRFMELGK